MIGRQCRGGLVVGDFHQIAAGHLRPHQVDVAGALAFRFVNQLVGALNQRRGKPTRGASVDAEPGWLVDSLLPALPGTIDGPCEPPRISPFRVARSRPDSTSAPPWQSTQLSISTCRTLALNRYPRHGIVSM